MDLADQPDGRVYPELDEWTLIRRMPACKSCGNVTETDEGHLQPQIAGWFKEAGQRTTTAMEYMNDFGHPRTQWTGVDRRGANNLVVAQIGAEHTEAMRRALHSGARAA
jgi:hypothetical protein